jgi:hypothetical protein
MQNQIVLLKKMSLTSEVNDKERYKLLDEERNTYITKIKDMENAMQRVDLGSEEFSITSSKVIEQKYISLH